MDFLPITKRVAIGILLTMATLWLLWWLAMRWLAPISRGHSANRVIPQTQQDLNSDHPAFAPALALIESRVLRTGEGAQARTQPRPFAGDLDGDNSTDTVSAQGMRFNMYLSTRGRTVTQYVGSSWHASLGMDDVDADGHMDSWKVDSGDARLEIFFGNSRGEFSRQVISLTHPSPDFYIGPGAFYDVDDDGHLDFVAIPSHIDKPTSTSWIRLLPK